MPKSIDQLQEDKSPSEITPDEHEANLDDAEFCKTVGLPTTHPDMDRFNPEPIWDKIHRYAKEIGVSLDQPVTGKSKSTK